MRHRQYFTHTHTHTFNLTQRDTRSLSILHSNTLLRPFGCEKREVQMKADCMLVQFKTTFRRNSITFIELALQSPAMPPLSARVCEPISIPCCRCRCWPRMYPQCYWVQGEEAASQGHFQISLVGLSCGREASWLTLRLFFLDMSAYKGHLLSFKELNPPKCPFLLALLRQTHF